MKTIAARRFLLSMLMVLSLGLTSKAQDMNEIVEGLKEPLELSDEQVPKVNQLMTKYAVELNKALAKHEDAEEPDPEAMIADMRGVRDDYRKELSKALSKDQYNNYLGLVDGIMTEMFEDLAEIRLIDMKPMFDLTDDQVAQLRPVFGKNMLAMVRIIFENAGTRLSVPKKVSIGKQLKKIQASTREGLETTLNPDQLMAYDAWKEEQKAQKEGS